MMNVMYATDNNYAEIMAVSIMSLLKHNTPSDICLYIVTDSVSDENKNRLSDMIKNEGADLVFIEKPDIRGMLGVELKTLRWSDSAYSRLFLKMLFAEYPGVDKLLYIDCDTIIVDSLEELYETDVVDYLGAACLECMSKVHKWIVGATKKDNYVNTGMLLLNVNRWRVEDIDSMMGDFIKKYKGKTEYVDQGVINGTISNRFKLVSPRYNLTCLAYDFTYEEMQIYRKPDFGYSKDEWLEAIERPAVVHFTTSFLNIRPWFEGSKHPYAAMWKEIHDTTPWRNNDYRELRSRRSRDRKESLYRKMPRGFALGVAGFLHSYIKPCVFVISGWLK